MTKTRLTQNFNLQAEEPRVLTMTKGTSPIIILGAHNGWHVPRTLHDAAGKPLGLDHDWFSPASPQKRHEACDWGMNDLFTRLSPALSAANCTTITANYSRLVCDLNRTPDFWLTTHADELGIAIPGNTKSTQEDKNWRENTFYTPWFHALESAINHTKQQHGHAIVLDLHSFTPTWHGKARNVDVGSIRLCETRLSELFSNALQKQNIAFTPDAPYNLKDSAVLQEKFAAKTIIHISKTQYFGLEFRNDLLQREATCAAITGALTNAIHETLAHPDLAALA